MQKDENVEIGRDYATRLINPDTSATINATAKIAGKQYRACAVVNRETTL